MTEETESTDTQETDTEQPPPETTDEGGQQQHQESDAEKQAREMGWRPAEEWDGDTGKHLSAEEFIARNERLKSRGDDILKTENAKLNRRLSEMEKTLDDLKDHLGKAEKRSLEKARKEIEQKIRSAAKEGDEGAVDAALGEMGELEKETKDTVSENQAKQQTQSPDEDPNFRAWWADNPWYNEDVYLTKEADQIAPIVARKNPNLQGRAFYDEITKELKSLHPDKFKNPKREKAASVEGTNNSGGSAKTKWDQVDAEGRAAFKRFVSEDLYKDTKEDREDFADIYLNG